MIKNLMDYQFPEDLKTMSYKELDLLAVEIREFLIDTLSRTGGHVSSNLGVVELTIALHKVFDSPKDKIIWDVGHQSYVHKLLTGRAERFDSLRTFGGISGFPKREESHHDLFDTGHSSNSISAGMGFAVARDLKGEDYAVLSVIGDGALTGGMAYEGLNNAGSSNANMIVILNDNEMSISPNTGGMSQHLSRLRGSKAYLSFKKQVKKALAHIPGVGNGIYGGLEYIRDTLKYAAVAPGAIFEELGFKYFGPVDGHNIQDLVEIFNIAKTLKVPTLIHIITKKGKGYKNAELNPGKFHGMGPFDAETGLAKTQEKQLSFSQVFGKKMVALATENPKVVGVCAAMEDGTGLTEFATKYPDRFYDGTIAEAHVVTFAAALAANGFRPVVAIYSTFLQRAYDQILIDVAMQNLPVIFAVDRGGIVGADGETHHGIFDLSYLGHIPNLTILAPMDGDELEEMMEYALTLDGPCAIRYPRGAAYEKDGQTGESKENHVKNEKENHEKNKGENNDLNEDENNDLNNKNTINQVNIGIENSKKDETNNSEQKYEVSKNIKHYKKENIKEIKSEILLDLAEINIIAVGNMVAIGMEVCKNLQEKGIKAGLINAKIIKPLDQETILKAANNCSFLITLEDQVLEGGFGTKVSMLLKNTFTGKMLSIGWPDTFIAHGSVAELMAQYKMDAPGITERICEFIEGTA